MKNKFILILLLTWGIFLWGGLAKAYQSQVILGEEHIQISSPEDAGTFYGELTGRENVFNLESEKAFNLYVAVLAPNVGGAQKNFSMEIRKGGHTIALVDGLDLQWRNFYDPFAGDNYWRGPEYQLAAEAGTYEIIISNPEQTGKYALVVGKTKTFSITKITQAFFLMPQIKSYFFNESLLVAYGNQATLLLGVSLMSLLGAMTVAVMAYRNRR